MLRSIIRLSLRRHVAVITIACALLGYGIYTLGIARYDVFPEFASAEVVIQTEAPGSRRGRSNSSLQRRSRAQSSASQA